MEQKSKTILDILLSTNRLNEAEAAKFPADLSNEQIEEKLRKEKLVESADIVSAYATLLSLPIIRFKDYDIKPEVLNLIPKAVAEKYQVIVFQEEGEMPGGKIKMAFARPANLKSNPPQIIDDLKKQKNVTVDIYLTPPEDLQTVLALYDRKEPAPIQPPVSQPIAPIKPVPIVPPAAHPGLKTVELSNYKIPFEVISKFPIEISQKYNMVVFENISPNAIKVAVSDPDDAKVKEILTFVKEKNEILIEEFVASPKEIAEAIKLYYKRPLPPNSIPPQQANQAAPIAPPKPQFIPKPASHEAPASPSPYPTTPSSAYNEQIQGKVIAPESDLDHFLGQEVKDIEALKQIAQTGNVPKILAATIAMAVEKKASDIHIEPEETDLRIRFRVDGVLRDVIKMPVEIQPAIMSRVKILSRLKIDEQRVPQDGRFDITTHGHEIDLRVSTLPTVRGEKVALRLLDKSKNIYTFEQLGIIGRNLKVLEENIIKPYGVILSTGPTGSGKSTTLYSILQKISSPAVNVITLEDPVEYEISGINQCQVKPKIGFSFADGLRSVLRQDPNVIMVGEIRDSETASMATHAALTGHLVLSTLHTNDAAGALPRLINMGIEPFLITSSVNVIIAQRLVRKICQKCKKEVDLPEAFKGEIEKELAPFNLPKPYKFFEGQGCSECDHGYSGRMGIYEILTMSDKIEDLAIKKRPASEIAAAAIAEGMITLKQDGLLKAIKGETSIGEVLRVTENE